MPKKIKVKDLLDPEKVKAHIPELTAYFERGGTWQTLMEMSDEALETQYAVGFDLYNEGRYEEATNAFTSLTILNPYEPRFWFALGAARQQAGDHEEALQAYLFSSAIDEENAQPLLQAARSLEALNNLDEARQFAAQAVEVAGAGELGAEAQSYLQQLQKGRTGP